MIRVLVWLLILPMFGACSQSKLSGTGRAGNGGAKDKDRGGQNDCAGCGTKGENPQDPGAGSADASDGSGDGGVGDDDGRRGDDGQGGDGQVGDDGENTDDGSDDLGGDDGEIAADKCDKPSGTSLPQLKIVGDDVWPFDVDYDDYTFAISGPKVLFDKALPFGFAIGAKEPTSVTVTYSRGKTTCNHSFEFVARKCPNKNSTVVEGPFTLNGSSQSQLTFELRKTNVFVDVKFTALCKDVPIPYTYGLYGFPGAMIAQ